VSRETQLRFDCFGGTVAVHVRGAPGGDERAAAAARSVLLDAHTRLTRFEPASELSRLNRDPRPEVPASPLLRRLAEAVAVAGELSGGLVDATMVDEIEAAGYVASLGRDSAPAAEPGLAPFPSPRRKRRQDLWRTVSVEHGAGTILRPPAVRIDGGGLAKGLLADLVAESLGDAAAFAVDCCGDLRVGGRAGLRRRIRVEDPRGGGPLHELSVAEGAIATSGTTRRGWTGPDGRPAHHLLDPRSGRPAETGVVQATALAPTGLLAEIYAKAALLSGPERGAEWLPFGGVLVLEGREVEVVEAGGGGRVSAGALGIAEVAATSRDPIKAPR
jgi:thiamine biosynthesis lipoprotein